MLFSREEIEKIYSDPSDYRSIHCEMSGSKWNPFIKGVMLSIENRTKGDYPFALLNKDQTISFFLEEPETDGCGLLWMSEIPTIEALNSIASSQYIRSMNELYYYNNKRKALIIFPLDEDKLKNFDQKFQEGIAIERLSQEHLESIHWITWQRIPEYLEETPCQKFSAKLNEAYIKEQLELCLEKLGLQKINNEQPLFNKEVHSHDVTEYQFNISPESFDVILKLAGDTYFYRGENSVLKLNKKFTAKPGKISLFPVLAVNDEENLVRAAGCQLIELLAVQLLHLLPDYNGEEEYFHWVPKKVEDDLQLGRFNIIFILNNFFQDNSMLKTMGVAMFKMEIDPIKIPLNNIIKLLQRKNAMIFFNDELFYINQMPYAIKKVEINDVNKADYLKLITKYTDTAKFADEEDRQLIASVIGKPIMVERIQAKGSEGLDLILNPFHNETIQIVDIKPDVENFYLLYGNIGLDELKNCKSVEVNTIDFLIYIEKCLQEEYLQIQDSIDKYDVEKKPKLERSLSILKAMIEKEKTLSLSSISPEAENKILDLSLKLKTMDLKTSEVPSAFFYRQKINESDYFHYLDKHEKSEVISYLERNNNNSF
ncbi:MAG: hypothetical protein HKM04_06635 [Legionellales bacterium]|nr:hypothetical protein [Legionellales bacterium]